MKSIFIIFIIFIVLFVGVFSADARVLAGLIDRNGNPVHSADEFTLQIETIVTPDVQGYRYTYNITNDVLSNQRVWIFGFFFQDVYSVVLGSASTPWEIPTYPQVTGNKFEYSSFFTSDPDQVNPPPLAPGSTLLNYTFLSPYPPGMIKMYAEGVSNHPWYESAPSNPDEYDLISPYGPGKVMSVIGPVKPIGAIAGVPVSNVTVQHAPFRSMPPALKTRQVQHTPTHGQVLLAPLPERIQPYNFLPEPPLSPSQYLILPVQY